MCIALICIYCNPSIQIFIAESTNREMTIFLGLIFISYSNIWVHVHNIISYLASFRDKTKVQNFLSFFSRSLFFVRVCDLECTKKPEMNLIPGFTNLQQYYPHCIKHSWLKSSLTMSTFVVGGGRFISGLFFCQNTRQMGTLFLKDLILNKMQITRVCPLKRTNNLKELYFLFK